MNRFELLARVAVGCALLASAGASVAAEPGRPGPIDVCALLSDDDAIAVATAQRLSVPTVSTVSEGKSAGPAVTGATNIRYSLRKEPRKDVRTINPALGICEFYFYSETPPRPRDFNGNCVIEAVHLDEIGLAIYRGRPRVPGLGDEAFDDYGTTVVRVKDILLRPGECSVGDKFVVEMYRRMAPKLR